MKKSIYFILLIVLYFIPASGQDNSPYFAVTNGDLTQFPLESTTADILINGPIADVVIKQVYKNNGNKPIEGVYLFPASIRAAVYHMDMTVSGRTTVAKIMKKQEARKTYEAAKENGQRTALLEQHKANIFQMNVANVMPGERIEIVLKYTEFIVPKDQRYQFVYPEVVGPRYTGEKQEKFAHASYTKSGKHPLYEFDVNLRINTAVPIEEVCSPSHLLNTEISGASSKITLVRKPDNGNRDLIIDYTLSGSRIETGLLTYERDGTYYFLCQIEPPSLDAAPKIVPREYIFVIDVSGSMRGHPLNVSKQLMKNLIRNLRPSDKFNITFFAGSAFQLAAKSLSATTANLDYAIGQVDQQRGGGGTNMLNAIKTAMSTPKEEDFSRTFVIVTDGYVNVEEEAFQYIYNNLNQANFFAFGIGSSVNRLIIEGIANAGRGEPFIVDNGEDAYKAATQLRSYIEHPVMTNIEVVGHDVELYDRIPERLPDLMARRPIVLAGKYKVKGSSPKITMTGMKSGSKMISELTFDDSNEKSRAVEYLWAREKIRQLDDLNYLGTSQARIDEVTQLGLDHNLLTKYTSFVAVDKEVVNPSGESITKNQPLPMPQGVPNSAIGFEMEIDGMVDYGRKHRVDVDVIGVDGADRLILESVLEVVLKKPEYATFLLINKEIELIFDSRGDLVLNGSHHRLQEDIVIALRQINHILFNKSITIKIAAI